MGYFPRSYAPQSFFSRYFGPVGVSQALEALKSAFFQFWW